MGNSSTETLIFFLGGGFDDDIGGFDDDGGFNDDYSGDDWW